jgi:hypothetical protein
MRALNLLNHPGLAKQRRLFHRCWSSLAGLLMGCFLAWCGHQWQIAETRRLQEAQSELQSARLARMQQTQEATQQQNRQRLQVEQAVHLQQIALHQQAWVAVHERLQEMAEGGLRLSRLQSDAGHVSLHGELKRFEAMAVARQSLSDQLGQAITLKDVTTGPASQVRFVWQTTWPALQSVPMAAVSGKAKP